MKTVLPAVEEHHRHVPAVLCGQVVVGVDIDLGHSHVPAGGHLGDRLARELAQVAVDAGEEGQLNHGSLLIGCNKPRRESLERGRRTVVSALLLVATLVTCTAKLLAVLLPRDTLAALLDD